MTAGGQTTCGWTESMFCFCFCFCFVDEGFMATGVTSDATDAKIQANIVAVGYKLVGDDA